jgi:hypothetical protein
MQRRPSYHRRVEIRPSLRTKALNALLRFGARQRLTPETDVAALRYRFEQLDARHLRVPRDVERIAVDWGGVAAEWIAVPESRRIESFCCCTADHSRSAFRTRTPASPHGCAGCCARER